MLIAGYYGLLRVGELAQGPHVILAENVHIGVNKDKMLFILRTSKTHNYGNHPQMVKIKSSSPHAGKHNARKFCPFTILRDFVSRRLHTISEYEQFFIFSDRTPIRPAQLRDVLCSLIDGLGLEAHLYNVHSLRIGRCVDLLRMGVSVETIKKLGRWKSNAVFTHFKE